MEVHMKVLENLLYTTEHEWLKVEGNIGYFGITDYAQHSLGGIVYVELPEEDDVLVAGENFAAIESVKAATDIFSPVDGKVLEINENLEDDPELLNKSAYEAWIVKIELSDISQLDQLMSSEEYIAFCEKED